MFWLVYNFLFAVGYLLILPKFLWRMWRRGGYRRGFMQRFGVYPPDLLKSIQSRPRIWIHAVSVGEVFVALRYMRDLRALHPDRGFVLTTTTSTGHRMAEANLAKDDVLLYYPTDFPLFVKRALDRIRPEMLILTESEIWPNMIRIASDREIPIVLINGRISDSSFRGYRLLNRFFRPILRKLSLLLVQAPQDRERLIALGVDPGRVEDLGSAKYDVAEENTEEASGMRTFLDVIGWKDALILTGGSTWAGEEEALLNIYRCLQGTHPSLRLALAPRHAERGNEVAGVIERGGFSLLRRSRWTGENGSPDDSPEVLLLDTTGELRSLYACSDLIFVGKSLTNYGGQNIIEPALLGKPVLVGPNMENFPVVISDFNDAGGVMQVDDAKGLEQAVRRLLKDPDLRETLGRRAREVVESRRGVVAESIHRMSLL